MGTNIKSRLGEGEGEGGGGGVTRLKTDYTPVSKKSIKSIICRTHQKVTKTLNKVINSSMKHKMLMAYIRIYTQQSIILS